MSNTGTMNFQAYLKDSFRIIKEEPIIFILGGLIIQILNSVTLSILTGPLLGGYMLIVLLKLRDNRRPSFNDLFCGFQKFRLLFPYCFVLLTKVIGFMLLIIPGLILSTWWIYVLPLMVDKRIKFSEAMKLSTNKVNETGFLMHLVFLLLVYAIPFFILNMLISLLQPLIILSLLLFPFQAACLASLYVDQFKDLEIETKPQDEEKTSSATPVTLPFTEEPGEQTEEETEQSEQPVSEETGTSDKVDIRSLADEDIQDENQEQEADASPDQAEGKSDLDSEKNNKDSI